MIPFPSSVTSISDNAFSNCGENLTIIGDYGSYAEKYAKDNNIAFEENPLLIGDVNNDGAINVRDCAYIQKYVVSKTGYDIPNGSLIFRRADVNSDGKVDVTDATLIQKYALHMIDKF